MIVVGVLTLLLSGGPVPIGPDTAALRAPLLDTLFTVSSRETRIQSVRDPQLQIDGDTIRPKRRRAIEVSEWYSRRLTVHRYLAYSTIPVFGLQYAAGT